MMVLLGFNGCSGETPCMYGSPYALHTIKGKVESNAGTAIKGIQIICNTKNNWIKPDTLSLYAKILMGRQTDHIKRTQ